MSVEEASVVEMGKVVNADVCWELDVEILVVNVVVWYVDIELDW